MLICFLLIYYIPSLSVSNKSSISLFEASREYGIQPQFEGLYRGLFLNSKGHIVLMNGNSIPVEEFCADVRYLSLALPMPLCACGLNNSGTTILSKSTGLPNADSDDHYTVDINAQLISAGAWRPFALDTNGSYPVYNAITHGKLDLALHMIRECTVHTIPHINDLHCQHTAMSSTLKMDHLYNRPALKAIKQVESEYFTIIEDMNSTSNFSASLGLLTFAFSRLEALRKELVQKDFLKYLQVSHSSDGAILDTIVKAKQILSIIGITSSSLIPGNSENSPELANQASAKGVNSHVNLFQALESVGPDSIVELMPFDTSAHLSSIITSWFYNRSKLHSKQYHQTVLLGNTLGLYHRWDLSCIDIGLYGYDAACQQSKLKSQYNANTDKKKRSVKIHVDTPDGFKLLSRQLSLETSLLHKTVESNFHSMEMFLQSLKYDLQAVQDALLSSYTIIEFGRWLLLARVLTTLTSPTTSIPTAPSYGNRIIPHPLARIHRKLVFTKQNQSKIDKYMSTMHTNKQHSLVVDGLNSRLRIVDNIDVLGLRTFLFFKQSMSSRFTSLRGLTLRGLQLVLELTNDTTHSDLLSSLITGAGISYKSIPDSAITIDQLLNSIKNVYVYHAVNIDTSTFEESKEKEKYFMELEALLIKINEILLRVEDTKTDITKAVPIPVGIRSNKANTPIGTSLAQNYFDITIQKAELDAVDNIFHSTSPDLSAPTVNTDIIVSYFADTRGRDSNHINSYLRDKFTGQYGMRQVKDIVKGDLTVCYETLTLLLNLLQSVVGLYHRRALYHLDVSYRVGRHKSDGKVFLALCTPQLFLNEKIDNRRDTNADIDMLWLKSDSYAYQQRLQLSRLLLQLQLSPYPAGTGGVDLVQSPIVLAAIFGADELLADILNYCDENQHQVGDYKQVTYHKSLLWHVLMAYPSKKAMCSLYERYLYHDYTLGGDNVNSNKILGYERCIRLLLDRDFAVYKPDGAYYSCADLAALKQLPPALILQLFHQEKSNPVSLPTSNNSQFNILHFCILMEQNDINNNLLIELLQQDTVANPSATLDMNNIFPPAVHEDIEMHAYFVSLHLPPVSTDSKMTVETRNEMIHNRTKASFIASLLAFIANRKHKDLLNEIDKNSIMRRRHIDPLWVALAKACSNLWSPSLQAMVTTTSTLPPWMSLVNKSQNTSIVTDNLWSYLHLAVAANNLHGLEMLLDLMGHLGQAMSGPTATSLIQYSCFYNNITMLQLLCDFGAMHCTVSSCLFHPLQRSVTPLELALQYSVKCMTYLLANGASITHQQVLDSLMKGYLNEECTIVLINHLHSIAPSEIGLLINTSIRHKNDKLIHILCRRGYHQVIQRLLLLNYSINLDEMDSNGYSPMHIAILLGQRNVSRLLSMSIIDPLYHTKGNKYMYYVAIIKRRVRKYLQRRAPR